MHYNDTEINTEMDTVVHNVLNIFDPGILELKAYSVNPSSSIRSAASKYIFDPFILDLIMPKDIFLHFQFY